VAMHRRGSKFSRVYP